MAKNRNKEKLNNKKKGVSKVPGAKEESKAAMILATIYVIVMPILAANFGWAITVDDIIKIAAAIVLFHSPIFVSIITDKLRGKHTANAASFPQGGQ